MTTRTTETTGSPAQLTLNPETVTPAMNDSLQEMHSTLLCPLCHQVFTDPSTLPCAHTFCLSCMDEYAANAWACPIPGCGFPLTCRGSREGSYLKINPQIQTVVSSLQEICKALNNAPKEWWAEEENEEEESDGKVMDFHQKSPSQDSHVEEEEEEEEDGSPQDSVQTRAFERPETVAPHEWMDPIAEGSDNLSCRIPSQSPNCSPIAIVASQGGVEHSIVSDDRRMAERNAHDETKDENRSLVERNESLTVRFQENVDIMDAKMPSVTTIMVASALSGEDRETLQEFVLANNMKLLTTDCGGNADIAVCANAEMETGDGYLVGRTYGYLLAVARGIPIVNISFFANKQANLEALNGNDNKHQVIGEADSSEWMAPQRAMKQKRGKEGTTLLDGYTVLLFGDFDSLPKAPSSKRVRSGAVKNEEESQTIYNSDRLECLLRSCGATVANNLPSLVGLEDRVAVLIRPDPHPRDWRAARKELEDYPTLPLIRGNWLLDSIGNYSVKEFEHYMHQK